MPSHGIRKTQRTWRRRVFLELYRNRRWHEIEDCRAYLARMAWRTAIRRSRSRPRQLEQELPVTLGSAEPDPEVQAIDVQRERLMRAMIDQLPEKLRQPLALAAFGRLQSG